MPVHDPQDDLIALAQIKAAQEALAKEKLVVEERIVAALRAHGTKTVSTDVDGERIQGTLVEPERTTIHEDKLKSALDTKQWNKVTSQVLDKEKLEAAVAMGIVDPNVVAAASEVKATKPFVKLSGKVSDKTLLNDIGFSDGQVNIKDSLGHTKPAARKRVAKPRPKPKAGK